VNRNLGDLNAMTITHPGGELSLESGADAASPDRVIDEIVGLGLTDANRWKS
jgi:hypothetical protein